MMIFTAECLSVLTSCGGERGDVTLSKVIK